jgi:hypothetical protein
MCDRRLGNPVEGNIYAPIQFDNTTKGVETPSLIQSILCRLPRWTEPL